MVSGRPFARTLWVVWAKLGFNGPAIGQPPPQTTCTALGRPAPTPLETFFSTLLLAALEAKRWGWFSVLHARQTLVACVSDAKLWQLRLPRKDRATLDVWIGVFFLSSSYAMNLMVCFFLPENNDHLFEDV